ncbi:hypothetical protein I316_03767 [Kwoniella heveanensis BCC8398]|uniref:Uncharacterized protein n=1 Tax=Kwoniella heveanensis BCC8398 TaxID=1296120 RepID=A0A1B9GUK5_9TREE|nr:hypothetical protein I316_03767 [Kwoniella heveanensis BCC8398]
MTTFGDLLEYLAPPDQSFANFDMLPLFQLGATDEYAMQEALGSFIKNLRRHKFNQTNLDRRIGINARITACPDLVNMRAIDEAGRDSTFRETRFHRDIVRWMTDYRAERGGRPPKPSIGVRKPDAMVYSQTIIPIKDAHPEAALRTKRGDHSQVSTSPYTASETSLEKEFKSRTNEELIYLLPSLVGEVKPQTNSFDKSVCQSLAYLLTANECCGTYLGISFYGKTFTTFLAINPDLCLFYDPQVDAQGIGETLTLEDYIKARGQIFPETYAEIPGGDPLPTLASTLNHNEPGLRRIWLMFRTALAELVDRRTDRPLQKLKLPPGRMSELFSKVGSIHNLESDQARRQIGITLRPDIKKYFQGLAEAPRPSPGNPVADTDHNVASGSEIVREDEGAGSEARDDEGREDEDEDTPMTGSRKDNTRGRAAKGGKGGKEDKDGGGREGGGGDRRGGGRGGGSAGGSQDRRGGGGRDGRGGAEGSKRGGSSGGSTSAAGKGRRSGSGGGRTHRPHTRKNQSPAVPQLVKRLANLPVHSESSPSDPGLTSSTSSGSSSEQQPPPPRTPQNALTIPLSILEEVTGEKEQGGLSPPPPARSLAEAVPAYEFQESDFFEESWQAWPADRDSDDEFEDGSEEEEAEERKSREWEEATRFLVQRAHLRGKGRFLLPVGRQVFDALLQEAFDHANGSTVAS